MNLNNLFNEEKVRLDPKCWTGKKIGNPKTKVKGGVRVNNCVPAESIEEAREIRNKKGRLLGTWDGREFTVDPDTQAWLIDELGPESAEQWVDNKTAELQKQSAPSEDRVKYYANELEKSDAQAGRPRQSRQQYYDLAVQMLSDQQGLAEEESEAAAQRKQYPSYYQHKDAGTIFRTQNDAGQTMNITPDDEEWDDYYRQQFPDMSTPNDEIPIRYNVDGTAVMVEGSAGKVVFSGQGADGGTYEIIQSGPTDFMIHANGKHIDTYGSLQRAMSVLKNEVPGLTKGVAEDDGFDDVSNYTDMRTTDTGNKSNQTYTSTAIAKNSATGQQKSLASWDHTDPKTGKNYSGSNYIDAQGNAEVQKNYKESKNPVPGQDFTTAQGQQMKYNPASKNWQQQAPVTPNDPHTNISTASTMNTKDVNGTPTTSYSNTTVAKNPATGSTQTMTSNDRGSFLNGVDEDQLDELDKKTVASWVRQQPERIKGNTGLSRTDFKKAKRLVDKSIPSAIAKYKDPSYGKQEPRLDEVSLGDYRKKATVNKALAQTNRFFDRDNPEKVAAANRTIAKREKGLGRADARHKPHTAPPVDKEKQRQQLTDKYPNIDQLVSNAEKNRDPYYDRAEGNAYYAGREAEQNYVRLKQIQRIIQGLNEEARQATLNTPAGDFTANITKDKSTNTVSGTMPVGGTTLRATKDMTPGGAQSFSVDTDVAPNLNLSATKKSADYNKGELAGTKSAAAKYTDTAGTFGQPGKQYTATRTAGVGFGGASGPRVGKNYVDQYDKTLADYMKEAKGINSLRNPYDLQPLEGPMGGGGGGGGGGGPSPFKGLFGAKPGSREASIAQPNANTMTIKQGPNPDYRPPSQQSQTTGDKPKIKVNPGETVPQAIERTKTQQEFGKFLQGQSGQTFGAGAGRGSVNPAPAKTMANTPVSVKNKPSAMNSMAKDLTNPPKSSNTNTNTNTNTTTNNSPRQNDRVDPLDVYMPRSTAQDPFMPRDPFDMVRPGYDGQLGSNPMPNTRDKQSSWLGKTAKGLGYAAGAYGAADLGSRAWDYYDQTKDMPSVKEAKKQSPEVEYDDEYDAMVARVKKLAGLGPMKTVYDPKKRQYRNMPTAQQPKK